MLTAYIAAAMRKARYEILSDDSTFYGEILEFHHKVSCGCETLGSGALGRVFGPGRAGLRMVIRG